VYENLGYVGDPGAALVYRGRMGASEQRLEHNDILRQHLADDEDCGPTCRICFDSEPREELIAPCACRGSIEFVHADCLREWMLRTMNSESRHTCSQCTSTYTIQRGVWASRRRILRLALAVIAFVLLALLMASALPWYARCYMRGIWLSWPQSHLDQILSPGLIGRIEQLNWMPGEMDANDWQRLSNLGACQRLGEWHLDAACTYGVVKISGLGLNLFMAFKIFEWFGDPEIATPTRLAERLLGNLAVEYASAITGGIAVSWWWFISPHMAGYMPTGGDSLAVWILLEGGGLYCILAAIWRALEDVELSLLERRGRLQASDLLILDRKTGTYR